MVASHQQHRQNGRPKAKTARIGSHRVQPSKGTFYESSFTRQVAPHMNAIASSRILPPSLTANESAVQHTLLPTGSLSPSLLFISQDTALLEDLKGCKTWQTDSLLPATTSFDIEGDAERQQAKALSFYVTENEHAGDGLCLKQGCRAGEVIASEMPRLLIDFALLQGPNTEKDDSLLDVIGRVGQLVSAEFQILTDLLEAEAAEGELFAQLLPITLCGRRFLMLLSKMSKINHSCRPNAHLVFDETTLRAETRALRPLRPTEEISISYIDPCQTRTARQCSLHNDFGFTCICAICDSSPAKSVIQSDFKRQHIRDCLDRLLVSHSRIDFTIDELKHLVNMAIEECLPLSTAWIYFLGGARLYHRPQREDAPRHGKRELQAEHLGLDWLYRARSLFTDAEGPGSKYVRDIEGIIANQHNHFRDKQASFLGSESSAEDRLRLNRTGSLLRADSRSPTLFSMNVINTTRRRATWLYGL